MKCVVNNMNGSCSVKGLPTESGIYLNDDALKTFMLVLSSSLRIVWNSADNHALLTKRTERFWLQYTWTKLPVGTEVKFIQE